MTARSLEERFRAAVDAIERPGGDMVGPVLAAIGDDVPEPAPPAGWPGRPRWRLWPSGGPVRAWAMAAIVAVVVVTVVVAGPARQSVARWLGIGATRVVVEPGPAPSPPPSLGGATAPPPPVPPAVVTSDVIASLGPPIEVVDGPGRSRTYRWPATGDLPALAGTTVGAQLTARLAEGEVVTKRVEPGVEIVFVELPGRADPVLALWIGGAHWREASSGGPELAQQVLVWVDGGIEYRLEIDAGLDEALALAGEVEPGTDLLAPG